MKGHITDREDADEGGTERTGKTAMKGHTKDWEDGNEGAQNGLGIWL